jgi:hypothetical protein
VPIGPRRLLCGQPSTPPIPMQTKCHIAPSPDTLPSVFLRGVAVPRPQAQSIALLLWRKMHMCSPICTDLNCGHKPLRVQVGPNGRSLARYRVCASTRQLLSSYLAAFTAAIRLPATVGTACGSSSPPGADFFFVAQEGAVGRIATQRIHSMAAFAKGGWGA